MYLCKQIVFRYIVCLNMRWHFGILLFALFSVCIFVTRVRFRCNVHFISQLEIFRNIGINNRFANVITSNDASEYPSLTLVVQASNLTRELDRFVRNVHSIRRHVKIYLLLSTGSFSATNELPEFYTAVDARITRCDPIICDNLVFSIFAYEVTDFMSVLRWNSIPSESTALDAIRCREKRVFSDWFGIFDMPFVRSAVSSPGFSVEYVPFNPIERLESFVASEEHVSPSHSIAVVMNIFKRNYFDRVLSSLCNQTTLPAMILLIQNEAHLSNVSSFIPYSCHSKNIPFYHVWNSNWNAYSFFRHYVPIPTEIGYTVITDDDLFLEPNALERGMNAVQEFHCVVTEHGGKITSDKEGFSKWEDVQSSNGSNLMFADYASLPQFALTEWRKLVYRNNPFYRRFGDILFVSLSMYYEGKLQPCILPRYSFCEVSRDNDGFSTLNSHRASYAEDYNKIAAKWIDMGYIPLMNREYVL